MGWCLEFWESLTYVFRMCVNDESEFDLLTLKFEKKYAKLQKLAYVG